MDQAHGDLRHARSDIDGGYYNWACFSAQQAAERALKAVFQKMGAEAWGYSVADLLLESFRSHKGPQALMDAAMELDKACIPTRYPNALPAGSPKGRYTKTEAERLTDYAEKIIEFCEGLLSQIG
jgi:HEPN domain-containing protein